MHIALTATIISIIGLLWHIKDVSRFIASIRWVFGKTAKIIQVPLNFETFKGANFLIVIRKLESDTPRTVSCTLRNTSFLV